jgi:hypothetical protein
MKRFLAVVSVMAWVLTGCGEYKPAKPKDRPVDATPRSAATPATSRVEAEGGKEKREGRSDKGEKSLHSASREKAAVGVGEKGRDYGIGPVTVPVAALFATKERVAFDIQIPKAMQLYKATNGHAPKTQDEFMKEIIEKEKIRLPELPERHRYVYDPEQEQLMVETTEK